ncbi:MAG: DNA methyltransferase [Thermodesulfobacteriota bacterium]
MEQLQAGTSYGNPGLDSVDRPDALSSANKIRIEDRSVHDWYRFVLSFPPHLVRNYLTRFKIRPGQVVLDPFCGTGTTLVECKKRRIRSLGVERNPMACFASHVKTSWNPDAAALRHHARQIAGQASQRLLQDGTEAEELPFLSELPDPDRQLMTLAPDAWKLLLKNSISPLPLHRVLVLQEALIEHQRHDLNCHETLALAKTIVFGAGNLHFGPEVGVGRPKKDAPVADMWLRNMLIMAEDLEELGPGPFAPADVLDGDARDVSGLIEEGSVDAVITSPPYPNEKDYTRTTRLESVILGFMKDKADLRAIKQDLIRSNTRNVYKDDGDDTWVRDHEEIRGICEAIEKRRTELGKTSGFERMYARVTKLYFGGMARHLGQLRRVLRPGAQLAYVVGDQASYLQVMIKTGELLKSIAQSLGYEIVSLDLFRTRLATATKQQLREEVLVLRWKG